MERLRKMGEAQEAASRALEAYAREMKRNPLSPKPRELDAANERYEKFKAELEAHKREHPLRSEEMERLEAQMKERAQEKRVREERPAVRAERVREVARRRVPVERFA